MKRTMCPLRHQRRWRNFLFKPRYSVNFITPLIIGAAATVGTASALIYWRLGHIDTLLNSAEESNLYDQATIYSAFSDIAIILMIAFAVFIGIALVSAMHYAHRVSGPMTAIVEILDAYQRGRFDQKRELRKGDLLQPIHDGIMSLGRELGNINDTGSGTVDEE